jgi:simple sugar transport system ATP-binding protein
MSAVEMRNISKQFGSLRANDGATLKVQKGSIHALVGENGAGKSTLMKILYGMYTPDHGEIFLDGTRVSFQTPQQAIKHSIGMVHQHFMLIPPFSVVENIILGNEVTTGRGMLDLQSATKTVMELSERFNLPIDPRAPISSLSVGLQQRVEILKLLYRNADILILDEPTPVLTPQEIEEFFATLRNMKQRGKTVILITHKLAEVMSISDEVTVMRHGKTVSSASTSSTSETELAHLMVGKSIATESVRVLISSVTPVVTLTDVCMVNETNVPALKNIHLTLHRGEIVGIAGVEGNGQKELAQLFSGLRTPSSGSIIFHTKEKNTSPAIAHIPDDRLKQAIVPDFSILENSILGRQRDNQFFGTFSVHTAEIIRHTDSLILEYDIRISNKEQPIRELSGGNQQKVVIARELSKNADVILANQPTRGLDIGAIEFVHTQLMSERNKGKAVLLISSDLEELLKLSDRIAVLYGGELSTIIDGQTATEHELGMYMTGALRKSA